MLPRPDNKGDTNQGGAGKPQPKGGGALRHGSACCGPEVAGMARPPLPALWQHPYEALPDGPINPSEDLPDPFAAPDCEPGGWSRRYPAAGAVDSGLSTRPAGVVSDRLAIAQSRVELRFVVAPTQRSIA